MKAKTQYARFPFVFRALLLSTIFALTFIAVINGTIVEAQSCTSKNRTMSGSYRLYPAYSGSPRIYYEVKYRVNSNCTVTNVQDRTRGTSLPDTPMKWTKSCTNGTASCSSRNQYIPLSGAWTSWRAIPSSNVGKQYRHYTSNYYGDWLAYGYTYFGR